MSPLAKLLQIGPAGERPREHWRITLSKIWKRFLEILRSARVQRRVRRLELLERVALGNKQSVILLRVDQREFIVGCCGESVVLLVAPQQDAGKAQPVKRRSRARTKPVKAPVPAPVETLVKTELPATHSTPKSKSPEKIVSPLRNLTPSKARLLKAFAGRSR